MPPVRLAVNTRDPILGEEAQQAIRDGVDLVYEVAKAAYGPDSGNVSIESPAGPPINSHDGVFNLDHLHIKNPGQNMAIETLVQASRSTNTHVGDGTTCAAMVAASVYKEARKLILEGHVSRFAMARRIRVAAGLAVKEVEKLKVDASEKLLQDVAVISASDEAVGSLVSDTIQEVGPDSGVILENFGGAGIHNDIVSGFYFRRGFTDAALLTDPSNLESRFDEVFVLVCEKELSTVDDMGTILDRCIDNGIRQLFMVANANTEALATAVQSHLEYLQNAGKQGIVCTIVDAPEYGAMRTLFMNDLALYVGGRVLSAGSNVTEFDPKEDLGVARVIVNEFSTTVMDGQRVRKRINKEGKEFEDKKFEQELQKRIKQLTEELRLAKSPVEQEHVRARLGRLSGKIAILRIGGSTEVEQQTMRLHVEDAVAAVQAAIREGVVPGGGVTLARLPEEIEFKKAFEQPFKALMENGGWNAEESLWRVKEADAWYGYDLRKTDVHTLEDLRGAGVVDPTLVIKEVIQNGCSVAAEMIKTTVLLPLANREAKRI